MEPVWTRYTDTDSFSLLLKFSEQFDTSWVIAVFRCFGSSKNLALFKKPFATFYNMASFWALFTKRNRPPHMEAMSVWLTDIHLVSWLKIIGQIFVKFYTEKIPIKRCRIIPGDYHIFT
jgi:predicted membrane-bound mannosyltransferase